MVSNATIRCCRYAWWHATILYDIGTTLVIQYLVQYTTYYAENYILAVASPFDGEGGEGLTLMSISGTNALRLSVCSTTELRL